MLIDVIFDHGTPNRTKYPDVTEADNIGFQFLVEVRYFLIRVWRCDFAENSPENYFYSIYQKSADRLVFDGPGMIGFGPWATVALTFCSRLNVFSSRRWRHRLAACLFRILRTSLFSRSAGNNSLSAILAFRPGQFFDSGRKF